MWKKENLWIILRKERRETIIKSVFLAIVVAVLIGVGTENIYLAVAGALLFFVIACGIGVITALLTTIIHLLAE